MKEQDLIALGFKRKVVPKEESGDAKDWYYYIYDFTAGLALITSENEKIKKETGWYVEVFETADKIRFTDVEDVKAFILMIESAKIKN